MSFDLSKSLHWTLEFFENSAKENFYHHQINCITSSNDAAKSITLITSHLILVYLVVITNILDFNNNDIQGNYAIFFVEYTLLFLSSGLFLSLLFKKTSVNIEHSNDKQQNANNIEQSNQIYNVYNPNFLKWLLYYCFSILILDLTWISNIISYDTSQSNNDWVFISIHSIMFIIPAALAITLSFLPVFLMWTTWIVQLAILIAHQIAQFDNIESDNDKFSTIVYFCNVYLFILVLSIITYFNIREKKLQYLIQQQTSKGTNKEDIQSNQILTQARAIIANAAHDLKTPLASITMVTDSIKDKITDEILPVLTKSSNTNNKVERSSTPPPLTVSSDPMICKHHLTEFLDKLEEIRHINVFMLSAINHMQDFAKLEQGLKLIAKPDTFSLVEALQLPLFCMQNYAKNHSPDISIRLLPIKGLFHQMKKAKPPIQQQQQQQQQQQEQLQQQNLDVVNSATFDDYDSQAIQNTLNNEIFNYHLQQSRSERSLSVEDDIDNTSRYNDFDDGILSVNSHQSHRKKHHLDDESGELNIASHIISDKQWFQDNLLCLLSNAIKYSSSGQITVRIYLDLSKRTSRQSTTTAITTTSTAAMNHINNTNSNSPARLRGLSSWSVSKLSQLFVASPTLRRNSGSNHNNPNHTNTSSNNYTNTIKVKHRKQQQRPSPFNLLSGVISNNGAGGLHSPNRSRVAPLIASPSAESSLDLRAIPSESNSLMSHILPAQANSNNNNNQFLQVISGGVSMSSQSSYNSFSNQNNNNNNNSNIRKIIKPDQLQTPSQQKQQQHEQQHQLHHQQQQQYVLVVEVEDHGVGMSDEKKAQLFSAFQQNQRLAGGTGLGLFSLAKRIEALDGECGVRDRRDGEQGSLFWFSIPYRPDLCASKFDRKSTNIRSNPQQRGSKPSNNNYYSIQYHLQGNMSSSSSLPQLLEPQQQSSPTALQLPAIQMERHQSQQQQQQQQQQKDDEYHSLPFSNPPPHHLERSRNEESLRSFSLALDNVHGQSEKTNACPKIDGALAISPRVYKRTDIHGQECKEQHLPASRSTSIDESNTTVDISRGNSTLTSNNAVSIQSQGRRRLRILLVEDSRMIAKMTMTMLNNMGHDVDHAENGEIALNILRKNIKLIPRNVSNTDSAETIVQEQNAVNNQGNTQSNSNSRSRSNSIHSNKSNKSQRSDGESETLSPSERQLHLQMLNQRVGHPSSPANYSPKRVRATANNSNTNSGSFLALDVHQEYDYLPGYDVIFMDLQMPVLDGLEATKRLREYEQKEWLNTSSTSTSTTTGATNTTSNDQPIRQCRHRVIVLSAADDKDTIQDAFNSGCDMYLAKPLAKKEVRMALKELFPEMR